MCSCPLCPHSAISWAAAAHSEQHTMSLSSPTLTFPFAVVGFFSFFFLTSPCAVWCFSPIPPFQSGDALLSTAAILLALNLELLRGRGCRRLHPTYLEGMGSPPPNPQNRDEQHPWVNAPHASLPHVGHN